jgi:phage terminase large subunit-like protein
MMTTSTLALPRWATPRTPSRATFGPQLTKMTEHYLGRTLMPWQQQVVDVALEVDPETKLPAYRTVILTVPRQSGKSTLILSMFLDRCLNEFWGGRQRCLYAAQTRNDARKKWQEDYVADMDASRRLRGKYKVDYSNGREAIRFTNGSQVGITATTEKAGHGQTLDLPVVDEAFALVDARLDQALEPAMATRRNAQRWIVSTAGTPDSLYLKEKVDRGRELVEKGTTSGLAYFEWSAPEDADPDDESQWELCMPALGHTIDLTVVRAARQALGLSEFQRAFLNQWVDRDAGERVISLDTWRRSAHPESAGDGVSNPVLAIDVSRDRETSAVALGGYRPDGRFHIQVLHYEPGTEWVVQTLTELRGQLGRRVPIVMDAAGPANSLLADLQAAGIEPTITNARQMTQACGAFYDDVVNDRVRHLDQQPLNAALNSGRKRELADTWAWGRKASGADISPLVACTLAHWGVSTGRKASYDLLKSFY